MSYVCQDRDSAGNWHDITTAPAYSCTNCTKTGTQRDTEYVCNFLPPGSWKVRAQADGYWQETNGTKHQFLGTGALASPSPYDTWTC